jgi:hypothetical protein
MPLQATSGAASQDGFGGNGVPVVPNYIEDVFSTYLYTGTGASQTITNGVDLSTNGGLVWAKIRSGFNAPLSHALFDTSRGVLNRLASNLTDAQASTANSLTAFNSTGFTVGSSVTVNGGGAGDSYVSWTFRKQPKFFDIVTYTGNGTAGRTVSHNLGSTPACIIVKAYSVDTGDFWGVYHRSLGATKAIFLSATNAAATSSIYWNNTEPTSTNFTVGDWSGVNQNGTSYVAYIYAHDAGGFGLTGTDNVISCGSFTTDGSGNTSVTLGYEPQWVMVKRSSGVSDWTMFDTMRGMPTAAASGVFSATLLANTTAAEDAAGGTIGVNATGFNSLNGYLASSSTFIYIAIRRGPMKVPTTGTSVFQPVTYAGDGGTQSISTGKTWPQDLLIGWDRNGSFNAGVASNSSPVIDRLRGFYTGSAGNAGPNLATYSTSNEASTTSGIEINQQFDYKVNYTSGNLNASGRNYVDYLFRRAPSFFDEVCYTGTGVAGRVVTHNLGVVPQWILIKQRNAVQDWFNHYDFTSTTSNYNYLNRTDASAGPFNYATAPITAVPTSTQFQLNFYSGTNGSGDTYVAYLFATCAGVSKVGSYTGTGTTLQVDCGFTAGARFVLIKRTDDVGGWYVWDSARGIVSGNDPYLLLNSTAAEVTSTDYIDTYSAGFEISSTAPAAINASGGTYIFLAIA